MPPENDTMSSGEEDSRDEFTDTVDLLLTQRNTTHYQNVLYVTEMLLTKFTELDRILYHLRYVYNFSDDEINAGYTYLYDHLKGCLLYTSPSPRD